MPAGFRRHLVGVGIFVAEKWVDSVVSVERHSERILVLKMVGDRLLNVFTVYAPHSGKPDEEKECFWNEVFHLVSFIPQNEIVVEELVSPTPFLVKPGKRLGEAGKTWFFGHKFLTDQLRGLNFGTLLEGVGAHSPDIFMASSFHISDKLGNA